MRNKTNDDLNRYLPLRYSSEQHLYVSFYQTSLYQQQVLFLHHQDTYAC